MRWALVKVCLAVTAMVVVAFAVPLGLVVQEMASDRAFSNAERQAATIGPTLSITTDPVQLRRAVESTQMGAARRMAVHVPAIGDSPPVDIGEGRAGAHAVAETRRIGRATTASVPGGVRRCSSRPRSGPVTSRWWRSSYRRARSATASRPPGWSSRASGWR